MSDSCFFFTPVQDMNSTIPCCDLFRELGICPCCDDHFSCPFYIHKSFVRSLAVKSVLERNYPSLNLD